jgi:ABC-type transporter Mla subunit MlaD
MVCLMVITGTIANLADRFEQTIDNSATLTADLDTGINQIATDLHANQGKLGAEIELAKGVTKRLDAAEQKQSKYWDSTARQSTDVVRDLRLLIAHADRTTLPAANEAIEDFRQNSDDALMALTKAADSLNAQVSDPHIGETIAHLDVMTLKFSDTADHLNNISAMGEIEVKRLTAPASLAKRLVFGTLTTAGKVGSALAGFK